MHIVGLYAQLMSALVSGVLSAPLPCIGPGDVDADSDVDAVDWSLMAPCLAGADVLTPPLACELYDFEYADVQRDGDVDLRDVAEFQNVYTDTYFDYGPWLEDKEAEKVALDFSEELRAPLTLYERARQDLLTIRAEFPEFEDIVYRGLLHPQRMAVWPVDGKWTDVLRELARYYQAYVGCRNGWCVLSFCDQLNMQLMAAIWEALPEVDHAQPSHYIGMPKCPKASLWIETPFNKLTYNFWCCDDSWCWRNLAFEMSESSEILSIIVSHPYECVPDCP